MLAILWYFMLLSCPEIILHVTSCDGNLSEAVRQCYAIKHRTIVLSKRVWMSHIISVRMNFTMLVFEISRKQHGTIIFLFAPTTHVSRFRASWVEIVSCTGDTVECFKTRGRSEAYGQLCICFVTHAPLPQAGDWFVPVQYTPLPSGCFGANPPLSFSLMQISCPMFACSRIDEKTLFIINRLHVQLQNSQACEITCFLCNTRVGCTAQGLILSLL